MTHNQYIELLYNKRTDIKRICAYNGIYGEDADDVEQEIYLKIYNVKNIDRYLTNGEVNMYIIFKIISNHINDIRKLVKSTELKSDIEDKNEEDFIDEKVTWVVNEIEGIEDNFKRTLVKLYYYNEHTIRSLSKNSGIGIHTIQPIIRKFKIDINDKIKNQIF